jgi:hypothetical protein
MIDERAGRRADALNCVYAGATLALRRTLAFDIAMNGSAQMTQENQSGQSTDDPAEGSNQTPPPLPGSPKEADNEQENSNGETSQQKSKDDSNLLRRR